MANIFTKSNDATPKPNRNTFDGSFVNNLTLKMGQITPCFCKEVIPGDSFRINPTFGFNFQPFVFPVQTDMQANLHFFYVRNRALWKGWMDFITKTENLDGDSTPPYIMLTEENRDMFETGKIGDYLGVPTVFYGGENEYKSVTLAVKSFTSATQGFRLEIPPTGYASGSDYYALINYSGTGSLSIAIYNVLLDFATKTDADTVTFNTLARKTVNQSATVADSYLSRLAVAVLPPKARYVKVPTLSITKSLVDLGDARGTANINIRAILDVTEQKIVSYVAYNQSSSSMISNLNYVGNGTDLRLNIPSTEAEVHEYMLIAFNCTSVLNGVYTAGTGAIKLDSAFDGSYGIPNSARELYDLPFMSNDLSPDGTRGEIRVSALPFRAVEACYNAFYRDDRNNPLIIHGKPYYNVYVQDKTGGADTNHYHLYQRNWEADVFTTAVQSPQQGVAPLVGVTASGQMTFQDEEGKTYYLQAEFGDDGHTITGIKSYSSDMPVGTLRAMVDTISTGISINDFRNVNALQRWLETNMRKGLRYKDQIEAHFGTSPTYSELDMPEFIGGMSRRVEVNKVVQTSADTAGSPLGTLGGNATILGGNGSDISCYADEHGWIIGFITITPKPVYSQQLNKQLTKTQLLDYYFPEFAHIGFQPILNQEIAPLQCKYKEGKRLTDVFGYQRAWYEYLANVDEVHGDFRTSLKDYIIHRVFNDVPELGVEFLTVSTDEANEVFANKDSEDDKIFGQIYFDVKMKRPLPTIGVPRLEVG